MKWRAVIAIVLLSAPMAGAGDFWLSIADDPTSACARRQRARFGTVASSGDVAADVARHFRGQAPRLSLFNAAFGNARVTFCGEKEREVVYEALMAAALMPTVRNEQHLFDYASMLGNSTLLAMIDARLATSLPVDARRRLLLLRDWTTTGIDTRQRAGRRTTR